MDANSKRSDKGGSQKTTDRSESASASADSSSSSAAGSAHGAAGSSSGHGAGHGFGSTSSGSSGGGISLGDTVKKLFTAGVSAAFMTEEGLRGYLAELKLPKELLNMILSSANKSKDEVTQRISKEVVAMIQKVDMAKEIAKIAETHKFKITAEIELIKKKDQE